MKEGSQGSADTWRLSDDFETVARAAFTTVSEGFPEMSEPPLTDTNNSPLSPSLDFSGKAVESLINMGPEGFSEASDPDRWHK